MDWKALQENGEFDTCQAKCGMFDAIDVIKFDVSNFDCTEIGPGLQIFKHPPISPTNSYPLCLQRDQILARLV